MKVLRKVVAGFGAVLLTALAVAVPVMSISVPPASVDAAVRSSAKSQIYDNTNVPQLVSVAGRV